MLDGFAGSGMTGVAAQWCGTAPAAYRHKLEMEWKKAGTPAPKWGARRVVLNDLSPAATFIGANYNIPFDVDAFAKAASNCCATSSARLAGCTRPCIPTVRRRVGSSSPSGARFLLARMCAGEVNFIDEALDEDNRTRTHFPARTVELI